MKIMMATRVFCLDVTAHFTNDTSYSFTWEHITKSSSLSFFAGHCVVLNDNFNFNGDKVIWFGLSEKQTILKGSLKNIENKKNFGYCGHFLPKFDFYLKGLIILCFIHMKNNAFQIILAQKDNQKLL